MYSIGLLKFKEPLKVDAYFYNSDGDYETGTVDNATIRYDFGMYDTIPLSKGDNMHVNYMTRNPDADLAIFVFNTIALDIMHAFFHYVGDPNYNHTHWALFGNLKDRVEVCKDALELENESRLQIP